MIDDNTAPILQALVEQLQIKVAKLELENQEFRKLIKIIKENEDLFDMPDGKCVVCKTIGHSKDCIILKLMACSN